MPVVKGKEKKGKLLVSIVIPTYNEEKYIEECIITLLKQSYKDNEIIVVDDGSSDKTVEIVKKFKKVRLIKGEHKGAGFSRNLGARKASGDIFVFVDADMAFPKDYLQLLVKPILEDKKVIGTAEETQIVTNYNNIWSRCLGRYISHPGLKERIVFRAIRKSKFMEMGGFDPKYGYADDKTFWFKYKVKSVIAKNSKCYHKNPETLKELYKQSKWIGSSTDNKFLRDRLTKYVFPIFLLLAAPLAIPFLSLKWCYKQKNVGLIFPMLIYSLVKYHGMIRGMFKGVYLNKKIR